MVVGDGGVGKTSLLVTYKYGEFPSPYFLHQIWETVWSHEVTIGDEPNNLNLHDTLGQEDYDRVRPLQYPKTDVFLICFCVVEPDSFENAREKWVSEITHFCPKSPFLLVGTQTDLREKPGIVAELDRKQQKPLTFENGDKLAGEIKAGEYMCEG